jgi:hypothetical protein
MKALNPRLQHEYGKGWVFSVEIDTEAVGQAKAIVDGYPTGYFEITVEKWSEKRSLQANAYFHVLCNKISSVTGSSMDETKKMLVSQYGTLARGEDGKYLAAKLPKNTDIERIYPYAKHIGEDENGLEMYLFFKRTSELTKDEMNRLIQGTVDEASNLGIEVLTPQELAAMMNRYKEGA